MTHRLLLLFLGLLATLGGSTAYGYRDIETGTFLVRDPAGFVDGPNLYTYVKQNPWTSFDPEGLSTAVWPIADPGPLGIVARIVSAVGAGFTGAYMYIDATEQRSRAGKETIIRPSPVGPNTSGENSSPPGFSKSKQLNDSTKGISSNQSPGLTETVSPAGEDLPDLSGIESGGGTLPNQTPAYSPEETAKDISIRDHQSGVYDFPDQTSDNKEPYIGQSEDIPTRLKTHERNGRYKPGTETIQEVEGTKTDREIVEHKKIRDITGGVPAKDSDRVTNKRDPIGPKRQHLLED